MIMRRTLRSASVFIAALTLVSCTSGATSSRETDQATLTQERLINSLTQGTHEVYGAAADSGGGSAEARIEIPLDRDGLEIWALCSGGNGKALVSLNGEGPFELSCDEDGSIQEITSSLVVQGSRLLISVVDAPEAATWSVAASGVPQS
ncbi:hypothetical protein CVS27_00775 [Arthrobacter glacialis]|uniref:Uncharacterized protein n=1 Tax=Arthrobacter glacialis TaxID=1664 RepID=A0A2S4A1J0_ARTGL|nr:hypothetical protein CVS27_00775 [Arthrobacter glacialis]